MVTQLLQLGDQHLRQHILLITRTLQLPRQVSTLLGRVYWVATVLARGEGVGEKLCHMAVQGLQLGALGVQGLLSLRGV